MRCRAEDLGFLERAPHRLVQGGVMPVSAERLFEVLADAPGWPRWFVDMVDARWTSSAPRAVGSTRTVRLTTMVVDETILAFEPGKRFAFRLDRVGLPLVRAMVEDYAIESLGPSSSRLLWTAAYEPTPLMTLIHPIARRIFGSQFRRTVEKLAQHLEQA